MLRGPQTLGELKQRTERLHRFESIAEVAQVLDGLSERELAVQLDRRPGQKEERYAQLLGGGDRGGSARCGAAGRHRPRARTATASPSSRSGSSGSSAGSTSC